MNKKIKIDKEKVINLYNAGMTQKEVAQDLGFPTWKITKFMKENDIKTRSDKKSSKAIRKEKVTIDSANIGYKPKQFEKIGTRISDELNFYIPEKWKV